MKYLLLTTLLGVGLLIQPAFAKKGDNSEKYTQEELQVQVQTRLADLDGGVALWVKGMICKSCGIGIRKKVSKLDFVNTDILEKGVEMDIEHMLLYVAIQDGAEVDAGQLGEAIRKAGYLPISLYRLQDGAVTRSDIE